jgi:hypothetical protein
VNDVTVPLIRRGFAQICDRHQRVTAPSVLQINSTLIASAGWNQWSLPSSTTQNYNSDKGALEE